MPSPNKGIIHAASFWLSQLCCPEKLSSLPNAVARRSYPSMPPPPLKSSCMTPSLAHYITTGIVARRRFPSMPYPILPFSSIKALIPRRIGSSFTDLPRTFVRLIYATILSMGGQSPPLSPFSPLYPYHIYPNNSHP